jgi:hypothetical protein
MLRHYIQPQVVKYSLKHMYLYNFILIYKVGSNQQRALRKFLIKDFRQTSSECSLTFLYQLKDQRKRCITNHLYLLLQVQGLNHHFLWPVHILLDS